MKELNHFINKSNNDLINNINEDCSSAFNYLINDRCLNLETIKEFNLGYCDKNTNLDPILNLFKWDISKHVLGKVIVPIYSEFGKIKGFATRTPTIEPGHPWWNIPSPFKKGNHLYLLNKNRNKIFKKNKIYIVEGYIDALILYQYGIKNVVAIMGTAYTLRKIALTARYCNNVCLCFDSDSNQSGENAKKLSIAVLDKYSFCESISVIDSLPLKEDPASFISKYGVADFLDKERILDESEIRKIKKEIIQSKNRNLIDAK